MFIACDAEQSPSLSDSNIDTTDDQVIKDVFFNEL